jgi:hypothetical protein
MKLQKFLTLSVALFAISIIGYAQVEPAEAPMFGNVRGINAGLVHDFGKVSGAIQSYQFKIKNTGKTPMDVIDIKIPAKVGITIIDLHIQPGQEGVIIASVDPTVMEIGKFATWFIVTTQQKEPGEIITKETTFTITGEVK